MTSLDELGRYFNEQGVLVDPPPLPLQPVEPGCFWCAAEGEHRQPHEPPEQVDPHVRLGLRLARFLEDHGYASPDLASLGRAAAQALQEEDLAR